MTSGPYDDAAEEIGADVSKKRESGGSTRAQVLNKALMQGGNITLISICMNDV